MAAVSVALAALLGLAFGSFLTVVVHRVPVGASIVTPRSACPSCGAPIGPRDNIPVVSYLLLRGRCRSCGERISARYVVLELLTAGAFAGAAARFGVSYAAVVLAALFAVLLAVAAIDLERKVIPNRIVYPSLIAFAVLVVMGWLLDGLSIAGAAAGLAAFGGGLLLVALVSPGGM